MGIKRSALLERFKFYERFGVEEYYVYDPDRNTLEGWLRDGGRLTKVAAMQGWTSPRLGVRFDLIADTLRLTRPDGQAFLTYLDLFRDRDAERQRANRLAERLRSLGIELPVLSAPAGLYAQAAHGTTAVPVRKGPDPLGRIVGRG